MAENNQKLAAKVANNTNSPALSLKTKLAQMELQAQPNLLRYFAFDKNEVAKLWQCFIDSGRKNPKVFECTNASIMSSLASCAQMKLYPGAMQEAALIPYGNELTFQPMVQGLTQLLYRSGLISGLCLDVVYTNDEFKFERGTDEYLRHIPELDGDRGELRLAYVVINLVNGGRVIEVMSKKQIESVMTKSAAVRNKKSTPWTGTFTDNEEMWKKTVLKRAIKRCPKTPELAQAIEVDNQFERPDLNTSIEINGEEGSDEAVSPDPTNAPTEVKSGGEQQAEAS